MNAIFAAILCGQLFPVSDPAPLFPIVFQQTSVAEKCECFDAQKCKCDKCDCDLPYKPQVVGCLDGAIANYGEAHRLAMSQQRPLVVCAVEAPATLRPVVNSNPGAVVCLATSDDGFPNEGIYYFDFVGGKLKQTAGPSLTKTTQVKGGHIECDGNRCRFVPSGEFSPSTNFSPTTNGYSFGGWRSGGCASGRCGW